MPGSLRDRQKQLAREAILTSLTEQIAERGTVDVSVADVAKRAGVSTRTVYNYFPTRQHLLDAVSEFFEEALERRGSRILPPAFNDLPQIIEPNFAVFEELWEVSSAFARIDTTVSVTKQRRRRTEAFSRMVHDARPELAPAQVRAVGALVRQLGSVKSWHLLTRELGLSAAEAGQVVAWAVRAIIKSLDDGDPPPNSAQPDSGSTG